MGEIIHGRAAFATERLSTFHLVDLSDLIAARMKKEVPAIGDKYSEVDLNHGDRIRVGDTIMAVTIEQAKVQPDESAQVREELARLIFE